MTHQSLVGVEIPGGTRSQSSVLGVVLLLGIVIAGMTVIVYAGSTALADSEKHSEMERAQHEMTLLDSRASMVALGESEGQTVNLGGGEGTFTSKSDTGWLRITHKNHSGNGDREIITNESMGAVIYENDDTQIAYQGGGVWRQDKFGASTMISPPEFHYRSATLTLPLIQVINDDSAAGSVSASITPETRARKLFPNRTGPTAGDEIGAPYNGTDAQYLNPIRNGTVNITVRSKYYQGWATYFEQRSDGVVTRYHNNNTVKLTLKTVNPGIGEFEMPAVGESLDIRGMGSGHPLHSFEITLVSEKKGYNNVHWSFYVDKGNEKYEMHIAGQKGGSEKCQGGSFTGELDVSVYYYNNSGGTTINEEWQNKSVDPETDPNFDIDCTVGKKIPLTVDLMGSTQLSYGDIDTTASGSNNKWKTAPSINSHSAGSSTTSFDIHTGVDYGPHTTGEKVTFGYLNNHYFGLLSPEMDLTVGSGPGKSDRVDESASYGTLEYGITTGGQYLTFLHITKNEIEVDLG